MISIGLTRRKLTLMSIGSFIISYCSIVAVNMLFEIGHPRILASIMFKHMQTVEIIISIISFCFSLLYFAFFFRTGRAFVVKSVFSLILTVFYMVGIRFIYSDFCNPFMRMSIRELIFGFCGIFFGFVFMTELFLWCMDCVRHNALSKRVACFAKQNKYVFFLMVILVCWIPYIAFLYPCSIDYDGLKQMLQATGSKPIDITSPVATTLIWRMFYRLGALLGDGVDGFFAIAIFQMLVIAIVLAYSLQCLYRFGVNRWVILGVLLVCTLSPIYVTHALYINKDTLFTGMCLLFSFSGITEVWESDRNRLNMALFIISGIMLGVIRYNGVAIVVLFAVLAIILRKRLFGSKSVVIATFVIVVATQLFNFLAGRLFEKEKDGYLGIQFTSWASQGTARLLKTSLDELTEEELLDLREFYDFYADEEGNVIANVNYDPHLWDKALNWNIRYNGSDYLKLSLELLPKHSKHYLVALMNNYYGYVMPEYGSYETYATKEEGIYAANSVWGVVPYWPYEENYKELIPYREGNHYSGIVKDIFKKISHFPILGWIFTVGGCVWLTFYSLLYTWLKKEWEKLVLFAPCLASLAVGFITGVNASIRYSLPIIWAVPFIMALCITETQKA